MLRLLPDLIRCALLSTLLGCGSGHWVAQFSGHTSEFSDGCSLQVTAAPLVIHAVAVAGASFDLDEQLAKNTLFDAAYETSVILSEAELTALSYQGVWMDTGPGVSTEFGEGVDLEFGRDFDSNNGAMGLFGTLQCGDRSVDLDWTFGNTLHFVCNKRLVIRDGATFTTTFEMDPTQLFRQSTLDEGSDAILGMAVLDADKNGDGLSQLRELSDVLLTDLDGYDDYPGDAIVTLYQQVEANNSRILSANGAPCTAF